MNGSSIDKKTSGAWIIHHASKLEGFTNVFAFEHIALAGKAGVLLSALSRSDNASHLQHASVCAIAKANGISPTFELPTLLQSLRAAQLIDISTSGEVNVLGLTTASVVAHTHDIFNNAGPSAQEYAAIEVSEIVSDAPRPRGRLAEYVGDTYRLPARDVNPLLDQMEDIGFVDYEPLGQGKLYFNGNLFRRQDAAKAQAVLSSLSSGDIQRVNELNELLRQNACVSLTRAVSMLGQNLFDKLHAIGMFDVSSISNERETADFVTRPSAFAKYSSAMVEDALDLAKLFVTSLTYGMTQSLVSRGRILMLPLLMKKLIHGEVVGPATAIGQDYKVLELRRVIQVKQINGLFYMRLLKKDVGELALQALQEGDVSEASLPQFQSASIPQFTGPEPNRELTRKQRITRGNRDVLDMLRTVRSDDL